jgi:hypothetical protein
VAEGSRVVYDDDAHALVTATLVLERASNRVEARLRPLAPSVTFDMAHTCEEPEHWLYYRTLVEATVSGWERPCRGWFEASRYGIERAPGG